MSDEKEIEIALEDIAEAIIKISRLGEAIEKSRLNQRAIILLIQNITKVNRNDIKYVLNALPQLEKTFLKKVKKK